MARKHRHTVALAGITALIITAGQMVWNEWDYTQPRVDAAPTTAVDTAPVAGSGSSRAGRVQPGRTALALLNTLPMQGRGPKTGYSRSLFGKAWDDDNTTPGGHNGCDTRNDILRRDLTDIEYKPRTHGCVVSAGTLHDPYTATRIDFVRGPRSSLVQIDHIVALSNAWQMGAARWDQPTRTDFANDPLNLLAVSGAANQQKRDSNAASWLPRNKAFRCTYITRQVQVKTKYRLAVTAPEKEAMARVLTKNCAESTPS